MGELRFDRKSIQVRGLQDGIWYVLGPCKKGASESEVKVFEVETVERWRAHCQEMGWRMDEAGTGITDKEGTIWML